MKCSVVDCCEVAEYYDPMDNPMCFDHLEQDVLEGTWDYEDFEIIEDGHNENDKG